MKFSKVAIVLAVIGLVFILWTDYEVFTLLSQSDSEQLGDVSPSVISSGNSTLFPLLIGLLTFVFSIVGIVKKEDYRLTALLLSLFTIVFAFSPILILILN